MVMIVIKVVEVVIVSGNNVVDDFLNRFRDRDWIIVGWSGVGKDGDDSDKDGSRYEEWSEEHY
ncbi:hypothetical protein L195_g029957 [Trifolium pratense]|uniref:Uncharacterized protein n=1 Tax=Trifolium pratense TaxID=57577 RepID=A0A2K3L685_TRIPR|nr:hypothetical protein L195_g029957 [Trifolium pratense]